MDMDEIFKECYSAYVFSHLPNFKLQWREQVLQLNNLWEIVGELINKQKFYVSFCERCCEHVLNSYGYDLKTAFKMANTTWRSELMTSVSNLIIVFYDHDVPLSAKPAKWNGAKLAIDSSICSKITSVGI